jgi:hypothetical protein
MLFGCTYLPCHSTRSCRVMPPQSYTRALGHRDCSCHTRAAPLPVRRFARDRRCGAKCCRTFPFARFQVFRRGIPDFSTDRRTREIHRQSLPSGKTSSRSSSRCFRRSQLCRALLQIVIELIAGPGLRAARAPHFSINISQPALDSPEPSARHRECELRRQWSATRGLPEEKSPCHLATRCAWAARDETPAVWESRSVATVVEKSAAPAPTAACRSP